MRTAIVVALLGVAAAVPGREITDKQYSCPEDYRQVGKVCERTITEQPITQCDIGIMQGNQCIVTYPKIEKCPAGTTKIGKGCQTAITAPVQTICPPGFVDSGYQCEATDALPVVELCDAGVRQGQQCVVSVATAPIRETSCPEGFEEHAKGGCWKVDTYDCTPPYTGKGAAPQFRNLVGKNGPRQAPANMVRLNVIQQTCERKISAPMQTKAYCPAGFEEQGKTCIQRTYTTPVQKCSNGGPVEDCFVTKTAPYQKVCPNGYKQEKGKCTATQEVPAEQVCSDGVETGKECTIAHQPNIRCTNPALILQGNICVGRETVPPQVTVTVTCTGKDCYQ